MISALTSWDNNCEPVMLTASNFLRVTTTSTTAWSDAYLYSSASSATGFRVLLGVDWM